MQALIYEGPQEMTIGETDMPVAGEDDSSFAWHIPASADRS